MMQSNLCKNLLKLAAVVVVLANPAAAIAASGKFEKSIATDGNAVVHVTNESGAVTVRGGDVDEVTIRARVNINDRLANADPQRAQKIIDGIKRNPPISVEGNKIAVTKVARRSYQKHASISYDIIVPRNSDVEVHSVSGNVRVSGVTGEVNAKSDSGKVSLAESKAKTKSAPAA